MIKKIFYSLIAFVLIIPCILLTACKEEPENLISSSKALMYNSYETLQYYWDNPDTVRTNDAEGLVVSDVDTKIALANSTTRGLIIECYDYLKFCEDGGESYTEVVGEVTIECTVKLKDDFCKLTFVYTDSSNDEESLFYKTTKEYTMNFKSGYVKLRYTSSSNPYAENIDILSVDGGTFIQYYTEKYTTSNNLTGVSGFYKFFYRNNENKLFYSPSAGTRIDNFEMPEFLYYTTVNN